MAVDDESLLSLGAALPLPAVGSGWRPVVLPPLLLGASGALFVNV